MVESLGCCVLSSKSGASNLQCGEGVDVPWSDIPAKILTEIAKHLKTPIDIYQCRCRAVCNKWRTCLPPPRNSNLLSFLLPCKFSRILTPFADAIPSLKCFRSPALMASTIYLVQPSTKSVGPSKSWLVTVEEVSPGKLFLRTPLRRFAIEKLPDNFPKRKQQQNQKQNLWLLYLFRILKLILGQYYRV